MVSLYDEELLKVLKSWTEKTNIHIYSDTSNEGVFSLIGDETNDSPIELPLIVLRRVGGFEITNPNSCPPTRDAYVTAFNETTSVQLNAIPIKIAYQLDVYARYKKEADLFCRDLIFNIINHPTCTIVIPFNNQGITHHFNLTLANQVTDNSNVPESMIGGKFTRFSLSISINDAFLWSVPMRHTLSMDGDGLIVEPNGNSKEDEQIN